MGGQVTLTDLPDRLRLLRKNVEVNLGHGNVRGSAMVTELIWGDDPDMKLIKALPDYGKKCCLFLHTRLHVLFSFMYPNISFCVVKMG